MPDLRRVDRVYDEVVRGLAVFTTPAGRKSFVAIYRFGNRNRWHKIGDVGIGIEAARRIAQRVLYQAADGRDVQAERVADRRAGSFAELHALYLGHARRANKSWKQAARLIERYVLPSLGRAKAAAITRSDVKTLLARFADRPGLSNAILASTSAVLSWAIAEEVAGVTANPCSRVTRSATRSRERIVSDAELRLLWPGLDSTLRLALLTGARMTELEHMRREDVDVDRGAWTLPGSRTEDGRWLGTKNARTRAIPLSAAAAALVDDHIAQRARRRSENLLARLVAQHDLPRLTPHDLRRSFASWVAGQSGRAAMGRLLGHSDGGVASVYDRFEYFDQDRRTCDAVARHVLRVVGGEVDDVVVRLR